MNILAILFGTLLGITGLASAYSASAQDLRHPAGPYFTAAFAEHWFLGLLPILLSLPLVIVVCIASAFFFGHADWACLVTAIFRGLIAFCALLGLGSALAWLIAGSRLKAAGRSDI